MCDDELRETLARSLAGGTLSRKDRQAIAEWVGQDPARRLGLLREQVLELVAETLPADASRGATEWLAETLTGAAGSLARPGPARAASSAYFSPGDECRNAIRRRFEHAAHSADVCVFTITDDRLTEAILTAHRRGVAVRILTDDCKSADLGSDIERLAAAGLPVRVDRSPYHMHHKFAIFDGNVLLTGSYNLTVGAARDNQENLIVTDDPNLVRPFMDTFERLWICFS